MRRPWIKIETATPDKPEICAIATRLRIDTDSVVGKLVRLWSWAEVNRIDGNAIGVTKEFIDKLAGRKGFAEALEAAGWLIAQGDALQFPNFERHNGNASKIRGQTAKRVEKHRQRQPTPKAIITADSIEKPTITPPLEATPENAGFDVEIKDNKLIDNDKTSNTYSSIQPQTGQNQSGKNDDINVTKNEQKTPLLRFETAPVEEADEGEGSGKLPRLAKRPVRLPADEDQPMLF